MIFKKIDFISWMVYKVYQIWKLKQYPIHVSYSHHQNFPKNIHRVPILNFGSSHFTKKALTFRRKSGLHIWLLGSLIL